MPPTLSERVLLPCTDDCPNVPEISSKSAFRRSCSWNADAVTSFVSSTFTFFSTSFIMVTEPGTLRCRERVSTCDPFWTKYRLFMASDTLSLR